MVIRKKIFLASGADLYKERDVAELIIRRKNDTLIDEDFYLEVVRWEQMIMDFGTERAQERYSSEIEKSDVVIVLFHKRAGKYTKEEFNVAYERYISGKKPRGLYVYFKKCRIDISRIDDDILEIYKMRNNFKEMERFFIDFKNLADFSYSLDKQLDLLVEKFKKEVGSIPVEKTDIETEAQQLLKSSDFIENITHNMSRKSAVEALVGYCGLFTPWKFNLHLRFEIGDIAYFTESRFSLFALEVKFRARKLILEKADELGIKLGEPGDLSEKSKRIERLLLDAWEKKKAGISDASGVPPEASPN